MCVGLIALSIRVASRALLFVSVVGLLAYLSYFAYEYFADVVGWPIALILAGADHDGRRRMGDEARPPDRHQLSARSL